MRPFAAPPPSAASLVQPGSDIRFLSTRYRVGREHHTPSQYRTARGQIAPYASSVAGIASGNSTIYA
eukprot:3766915-Rhodomonas_salina.2